MVDRRHIAKHRFSRNSAADCPIVATFCIKTQNLRVMTDKCENFQTFKIQDGGLIGINTDAIIYDC